MAIQPRLTRIALYASHLEGKRHDHEDRDNSGDEDSPGPFGHGGGV